jgi:signal recognition particle subunit SRP54
VHDVNKLAKQQEQMQTVMKRMKKMGLGGLLGSKGKAMMKDMVGEEDLEAMMQSMDPDALAADMASISGGGPGADTDDPLGANPFARGARVPPGLNPFGEMPGLSGLGAVTGKKKKR